MNCKSAQNYLSAYLDGELCGQECLQVRDHLSFCPDCRAEEQQLRSLKHMLRGLPIYQPTDGFEDRLIANVTSKRDRRPFVSVRFDWRATASLAAVSAIATLAVVKMTERTVPDSDAHPLAKRENLEYDLTRDQLFMAGHDPLGGSGYVSFASNGHK